MLGIVVLGLFIVTLFSTCSENVDVIGPDELFNIIEYDINELNYNELPYAGHSLASFNNYPTDDKGVIIFIRQGKRYYHPWRIAQKAIHFLDSYVQTNDPVYLDKTELFANKLLETSVKSRGAVYFPYCFDFLLHDIEGEKMVAPWYSGMAQGVGLSLFVRLYRFTGKDEYLKTSEEVFTSFTHLKEEGDPWVVYVDEFGYLWIEEYPMELPNNTLNGFIFGIYGLYDYCLVNNDKKSEQLLQACLTTIRQYISEFRRESDVSLYCLKHQIQSSTYHRIHAEQLDMLYRISGEPYFKEMSENFYNDYHE
jgi:hypothetical protein